MRSRAPLIIAGPLIVAAAALGIIVLTQSVGGQGSPDSRASTSTRTADETSRLSDSIQATQTVIKGETLADLIGRAESVANVPRSESSSERFDAPMTLDEALIAADRLVVGRVVEQHLEWGVLEPWGYPAPVLVSTLVDSEAQSHRVTQPVDIGERPDITGLRLTYRAAEELLGNDQQYAVLVINDPGQPDRYRLIRGYAYIVEPAGTLLPAQGVTPRDSKPASVLALETRFTDAKSADVPD